MYIFISYSGEEGLKYAKILNKILTEGRHKTFFFKRDNTIEDGLYLKIGKALSECRIIVMIITESSHESVEQKEEYGVACSLKKGQGIIKEEVKWGEFVLLTSKQYVKFNDSNVKDKMEYFLEEINRIPEGKKVLTIKEDDEIK